MATREEAKTMKGIIDKYGLRDYKLDPAGDPVVYSRRRSDQKDELYLYNINGRQNLAAFVYGTSPRKLGTKIKKLTEIGCKVLQQSGSEATFVFPNTKIREVSKYLKCDKIVRKQSQAQIEALKKASKSRKGKDKGND